MRLPELVIHPLVIRTVRVASVQDLAGRIRRVRVEGEQLGSFTRDGVTRPAFRAPGFDDHIKLIFSSDGDMRSALPRQHDDGIEWTPSTNRITRDYTPHSVDPGTGAFCLDFVMHGDGPAARWAAGAVPGTELTFVGPKSSQVLPADSTSVVMIGDETALPAIGRFLAERPLAVPAHVVVLASRAGFHPDLPVAAGDSLRVEHVPVPDGEAIVALFDAVTEEHLTEQHLTEQHLTGRPPTGQLPPGQRPFVWAAGEARSLVPLRRRLSGRVDRSHRSITGYWHLEDAPGGTRAEPALPEPPVAWLAIRAALQLGVLDALRPAPLTSARLAATLGTRPVLDPLMDMLAATGLLRGSGDRGWELTDLAVDLLDDPHGVDGYTGPEATQVLALRNLAESVRTGRPAWEIETGSGFAAHARDDAAVAAHLEHESDSLVFLQHGLLRVLAGLDSRDIVVVGPGAALVADLAARHPVPGVRTGSVGDTAEVVVSAMLLAHLDDAAARAHLSALAATAPRALVVDAGAPDGPSRAAAEDGLLGFVTTGVPARSRDRVVELAGESGWSAVSHHALGWGVVADEFALAPARRSP